MPITFLAIMQTEKIYTDWLKIRGNKMEVDDNINCTSGKLVMKCFEKYLVGQAKPFTHLAGFFLVKPYLKMFNHCC